ncbi:MAG: FAD-dependent monooxygenase, partial [Candidatus Eremiobacteraeota bacterium]|nr:FAD-dependent monooxygenase [Candidatus Eremiobacteraeota bacterium]
LGAPMDVLWFGLPRLSSDPGQALGRINCGKILVMIDRGTYWQCGYVIPKGAFEAIQRAGIERFCQDVARLAPFMRERLKEIGNWNDVRLLRVKVDRLRKWHQPGLLCIGDAAHAMSPIGGVGINLALQDAIAAANILAGPLGQRQLCDDDLAAVQRRREFPTRVIQRMQVLIQNRIIGRVLERTAGSKMEAPWPLRVLGRLPILQRLPAYLVGVGVRPEHVRTPSLGKRL